MVVEMQKKYLFALADQAIVSFSNFAVVALLGRCISAQGFANFYLIYISFQMANNIFESPFICNPLVILDNEKTNRSSCNRWAASFYCQIVVSVASVAFVLFVSIYNPNIVFLEGVLVSISIIFIQWQLYYRSILLAMIMPNKLLLNDGVTHFVRLFLVVLLIAGKVDCFVYYCWALGIAAFIGVLIGYWQTQSPERGMFNSVVFRKHFEYGKWLFAEASISSMANRGFVIVTSIFLAAESLSTYAACSTIVNLSNIIIIGIINIAFPQATKIYKKNKTELYQYSTRVLSIGSVVVLFLSGIVFLYRDFIIGVVYNYRYSNYTVIMLMMLANVLFQYVAAVQAMILKIVNKPQMIFASRLLSTSFSLSVGLLVTYKFGVNGLAFTICVASFLSMAGMVYAVYQNARI